MRSRATWTLAAVIALAGATAAAADPLLDSPTRHVRTTDRTMRTLLRDGYHNSPTFAALLQRLEASDVYVYVEDVARLSGALEGRLLVLPPSHGVRYVRVQVARHGGPNDSIAVLAHELRHAVEVAENPLVLDTGSLIALYRRIGIDRGNLEFDTVAAQETGRQVLRELVA
jgi:hypothetical protein